MADPLALRVLTAEGLALEDQAVSVIAPGELGYLGMLRNHAPLVTTLAPGLLTWRRSGGQTQRRRIGAGLLEVAHNQVTILTDAVAEAPAAPDLTGIRYLRVSDTGKP
ncbi:MAG: F0F1 ATP synthase subunit epsilon [Candidatus Omnitrophica bacterium]|nr:F0F1 ATP synthase subunit epsilon [Candidatus Omnitrophota bacterium]